MEYVKLRNGVEMPRIGLGTWQITDRVQMAEIVESAYQSGYRLIDTAAAYSNEIALAKALAAAEIKRTTIKRSRDDSRDLFVFNRRQENRRFVVLKDMII